MRLGSTIQVAVTSILQETPQVKRFTLMPVDGHSLPPFSGGSHITTFLPSLTGEHPPMERHYSLVSAPTERSFYQIAVRLSEHSKGGSAFWHQQISEGVELNISLPKNHFPLSFRAKHHVFYAAGIGITPFMSMIDDVESKGGTFELHYAARSREECPFFRELRDRYDQQCRFYFTEEMNRMTPISMTDQPIGTHLYLCGPEQMVTQFREAALRYGYPSGSVHFELFTPPSLANPQPFQAVLQKSGSVLDVPKDQTLLEVLLQAGVRVPYSCRVGACGTCEIEVLAGEVEHRDSVLNEQERKRNDRILTCVSRAYSGRIVLNI